MTQIMYAAGPVHSFHNNNGAHKVLQHSSLPFQTFYALSSVISAMTLPFGLGENAAVSAILVKICNGTPHESYHKTKVAFSPSMEDLALLLLHWVKMMIHTT